MILEDGLFEWASAQTELQALIGEPHVFRLYKIRVPQASNFPAIVIQRVSSYRQQRRCGPDGTVGLSIQIDHYGKTGRQARDLAETFRLLLQAEHFPVMMGGVRVKVATLENDFDIDDPEPGLLRTSQSWTFWHVE